MIYLIVGQAGSGKTTLANAIASIQTEKDFIHLDGDFVRDVIQNKDYSLEGRRKHLSKMYDFARILNRQGKNVIISMMSPFDDLRKELIDSDNAILFYVHSKRELRKEYHVDYFEIPKNGLYIDTDKTRVEDYIKFLQLPRVKPKTYALFIGRYQPLHDGHKWLFSQQMEQGKNILIGVRDMPMSDKNPYSSKTVKQNIESFYKDEVESGRVKVVIIPDIDSVNYGRGVGYQII